MPFLSILSLFSVIKLEDLGIGNCWSLLVA